MAIANLGKAAIALLVLATSSLAMAAAPKNQNPGAAGGALQTPRAPQAVLYDQTSSPAGNGAPDQDFEADYDAYDSEGADDFVVPAGGWVIQSVDTIGTLSTGPCGRLDRRRDVLLGHRRPAGHRDPGLHLRRAHAGRHDGIVQRHPADGLHPGRRDLLDGDPRNLNYGTNGQHFWSNRTVASGSNAVGATPVTASAAAAPSSRRCRPAASEAGSRTSSSGSTASSRSTCR